MLGVFFFFKPRFHRGVLQVSKAKELEKEEAVAAAKKQAEEAKSAALDELKNKLDEREKSKEAAHVRMEDDT